MRPVILLCTEAREDGQRRPPKPLSAYEDSPAWVLLGNPGAGKTTVFEQEAERTDACFVTARDLITFDIAHKPEWRGKTLFIDGLDEIRAGSPDVRTPLDRIRAQLDKLGKPRFRLSCREADWFGASDQDSLKAVSPDRQKITVLHLDPLTDENVIDILIEFRDEADARTFVDEAKNRGLEELLKNPQTLDMLAKTVIDGDWPDSRTETFEMACRKMLGECNREHKNAARGIPISETRLLDAAGFLCAAQLIAGNIGYALTSETEDENFPYINDLDYDDHSLLRRVTKRNLFKASGEERMEPAHRHIAEYLAAGYLAGQIDSTGLPVGRILSLITGEDGIVVSELRGLSAWLAARCISERRAVIDRDPLGVVLYGDVKAFTVEDKSHLLDSLHKEAKKNPWFCSTNWTSSPFGALATPDMEIEFEKILAASGRDESDQELAQCVLDAMTHGDRLPALDEVLIRMVRDETWRPNIRLAALEVILKGLATDPDIASRMKLILEEISCGAIIDSGDDLAGRLLAELYPETVKPEEVFDHLHAQTNPNWAGGYFSFWDFTLLEKSSDEEDWHQQKRWRNDAARRKEDEQKKRTEWVNHIKSQESVLQEGTAHPRLLHDLAGVYFNRFSGLEGDTPVKRLRNFLGGNEGLAESVLEGFRCSMDRNDVPTVGEIIRLKVRNQTHLLSGPVLAGLAENSRHSPEYVSQLNDSKIERMVAFYMTGVLGNRPSSLSMWYSSLLVSRPELVSRILIEYVAAALHGKKRHAADLHTILNSLVYDAEYEQVARLATSELLKAFPARCTNHQLELLGLLLKSSLRHLDREGLLVQIEEKLGLRSMNSAQRVHWLATGLLVDPTQYRGKFTDFIQGDENRARHLARFLEYRHEQWLFLDDLPVSTIELLVHILGRYFAPYSQRAGAVSQAMYTADFLGGLIRQLGSDSTKEATDALDSLLKDPGLVKWRDRLQHARFGQLAARREADFRHLEIKQVVSALKNKEPANAGDLAALVLDILKDMARRIPNGNTDDYKQYWNLENRKPVTPRHEDVCRDTLLPDLRQRLAPLGIDAQPEGQYADEKRSDIRVSTGGEKGFAIPIEIKKNTHRDLWRAIHDQLVARYTRAPLADGFGIYLVFWFGSDKTQPPPNGKRPRSADELEQRLRKTLSVDEGRKISICVVNVEANAGSLTRKLPGKKRMEMRMEVRLNDGNSPKAYRAGGSGEAIAYACRTTALGLMIMAATDKGVCFVQFGDSEGSLIASLEEEFPDAELSASPAESAPELDVWVRALDRHISEGAARPDLPLDIRGTAFQMKVWQFLLSVREGETLGYGELAANIGQPGAVRAAASACARNRIGVLIPCHRVLRGDGGLGGYRWGLERKRALLDAEKERYQSSYPVM